MLKVELEKITLNFGAGTDETKLNKGIELLKKITGREPIKTFAKRRIPTWGIRPGLPIGAKVTLRRKAAIEILDRLLKAVDYKIKKSCIDGGNISFGIREYVDIPNVAYDPRIGLLGLEVCITLKRPGYRVASRWRAKHKIPKRHRVSTGDAVAWLENLGVKIE